WALCRRLYRAGGAGAAKGSRAPSRNGPGVDGCRPMPAEKRSPSPLSIKSSEFKFSELQTERSGISLSACALRASADSNPLTLAQRAEEAHPGYVRYDVLKSRVGGSSHEVRRRMLLR